MEVDESDLDVVGASELRPARGKRPIFDCYWNGRLIPYSTIDEYVVYFLTVVVIAFVFIILHSAQYNGYLAIGIMLSVNVNVKDIYRRRRVSRVRIESEAPAAEEMLTD